MILAACVVSTALVIFSQSAIFPLSFGLMFFIGLGMMLQMASSNTILQTIVEDDKRGRVMSLYTMSFMGISPIGSFLVGTFASRISAQRTLLICAALLLGWSIYSALRLPKLQSLVHNEIQAKTQSESDKQTTTAFSEEA
jgi:MFS family permease